MRKRLLTMLAAVVIGVFVSSGARAIDYGELGFARRDFPTHLAGTILNEVEGKGDVLIFPYYDVRNVGGEAQDTYFAIINEESGPTLTAPIQVAGGVAAKLRFREWDKSQEVFDVDIWLSRADVWVGRITRNTVTGMARIFSPDWVIVNFTPTTFTVDTPLVGGFDFFWFADYPPLSNNLMGYFEVIGEERTGQVAALVGGVWQVTRYPDIFATYPDCPNVLWGYAYLVRSTRGVAEGYRATAIANFYRTPFTLFQAPGGVLPLLRQCEDSLEQLEFEISKEDVFAGYDVSPEINGAFSLIVTFPTKHFHFFGRPNYTIRPSTPPGTWPWGAPFTGAHANAGEIVRVNIYDRDEHRVVPTTSFVSPQPAVPTVSLPWEVNVISLYRGTPPTVYPVNPLIRDNLAFSTGDPGFVSGYIWLNFQDHHRDLLNPTTPPPLPPDAPPGWALFSHIGTSFSRYYGLPLIALALQEAENIGLAGGLYGEIIPPAYEVEWFFLGTYGAWTPDLWTTQQDNGP